MSLLDSHYLEFDQSFDQAWELVQQCLSNFYLNRALSGEIEDDKEAKRITATGEIGNAFQIQRQLILQLVFSEGAEKGRDLSLHYMVVPLRNIEPALAIFQRFREQIELVFGSKLTAYKSASTSLQLESAASTSLIKGFEFVLVGNVALFTLLAFTMGIAAAGGIVICLQVLWVPVGIITSFYRSLTRPQTIKGIAIKPLERLWLGSLAFGGGMLISAIVCPIILWGLCTGLSFVARGGG
jgi:hypothetical protein